mmetsp:Transcript_44265/g.62148  ORF Transcript_44265/g.62148 Transcript_44265/m.62148 type:complete len:266 (+) Transcript_44265:40-837(+)
MLMLLTFLFKGTLLMVSSGHNYSLFFLWSADDSDRSERRGRVSQANLPLEVELEMFLRNIDGKSPSWKADIPIAYWDNVFHDDDGALYLDFENKELQGTIDLRYLPKRVAVLRMFQNLLNGTLALSLLHDDLQSLHLSANEFSGAVDLSQLPAYMHTMELNKNLLVGKIDLSSLPASLKTLNLSSNALSGELDLTLLHPPLTYLDLARNEFSGFPNMKKLPLSLWLLDLSHNLIEVEKNERSQIPSCVRILEHGVMEKRRGYSQR